MTSTSSSMAPYILCDTNLLIRLVHFTNDSSGVERFKEMLAGRYSPCVCLQNLVELWSVATRPSNVNGFGLAPSDAHNLVSQVRKNFEWIPDAPETVNIWLGLCTKHAVSGRRIHDARLAATALANGVKTLATYNQSDFHAFEGLTIVTPSIS